MWDRKSVRSVMALYVCWGVLTWGQTPEKTAAATLTISFSASRMNPRERIDFEITLRNVSSGSIYVCGDINIQDAAILCNYTLQVRRKGTDTFQEPLIKLATDSLGPWYGDGSVSQFKERKNVFFVRPRQSFGIKISDTWGRRIATSPGRYEVRVVYNSATPLPVTLDKPFLQETIISNLVEIEVLP